MKRVLVLVGLVSLAVLQTAAQQRMKLQKTLTLTIIGEGGSNGASVAWHPVLKKYYAAMAGNKSYPVCVFSESGKLATGGSVEEMIDVRGLWYNSKSKQVQGNSYDDNGWFEYQLSPAGIPTNVKVLHEGMQQPDAQCVGAFNGITNEVYFFDGEAIYTYNAATAEEKSNITLDAIMEKNGDDPVDGYEAYSQYLVMYTGIKGKEIALLNIDQNVIELFNLEFKRTAIVAISEDQPVYENFNCSYANGMFWFFDKDNRQWTGYKPVADGSANGGSGKPNPTVAPVIVGTGGGNSNTGGSKPTVIINSGDLYSTADITTSDAQLLANWKAKYGSEKVDELVKRSKESGWPDKISTFTSRSEVRPKMVNYKTYRVASLNDNKSLLWVPAAENGHMPQGMMDNYDIYFVIGNTGLELGDLVPPFSKGGTSGKEPIKGGVAVSVAPVKPANDFASQLNAIVADYANGFKNIKGDQLPKESDYDVITKHKSKVLLKGATKSYLSASFGFGALSYVAVFGEPGEKEEVRKRFNSIVSQVDQVKFSCCTFSKTKEIAKDNVISQPYLPFDLNGKMGKEFDNLVLDITMTKYLSLDADKQNYWSLVLRVYKLEN